MKEIGKSWTEMSDADKLKWNKKLVKAKEQVKFNNLWNFTEGTSFGASTKQSVRDSFSCYYRMNSFGKWKIGASFCDPAKSRRLTRKKRKMHFLKANSHRILNLFSVRIAS